MSVWVKKALIHQQKIRVADGGGMERRGENEFSELICGQCYLMIEI
jgi:predicted GTPase